MALFYAGLGLSLAAFALAAAWHLLTEWQHMARRVEIAERRIRELAEARQRHLPYKTADEIENALAALWRLQGELELKAEFVENAIAHLRLARNGYKDER